MIRGPDIHRNRLRGFRKLFPNVLLPTQVVELVERYRVTICATLEPGKHRRIAGKIMLDDQGIGSLKVKELV
jgi:hypothetical protein